MEGRGIGRGSSSSTTFVSWVGDEVPCRRGRGNSSSSVVVSRRRRRLGLEKWGRERVVEEVRNGGTVK